MDKVTKDFLVAYLVCMTLEPVDLYFASLLVTLYKELYSLCHLNINKNVIYN